MGFAFAACSPSVKVVEPVETPTSELATIDSLMWRQPDSALAQLQRFAASPAADSLDAFNGHYCQMLISELLYKNYYGQSNREGLLHAVDYFDSLTANTNTVPQQERNVFLDARAHYINGAGFYEKGDVVQACAEYLKALELMEGCFEEKTLTGKRAQFMANTYNRLGDLFSEQFMMESSITCYENALVYCKIEPTSPIGVSNILYRIGKQYDKKNEIENARLYYSQALDNMTATDNMVYRDIVASKAFCDFKVEGEAKYALDELSTILMQANTENERLNRYFTVGCVYFFDGNYDSALFYFEPVFANKENVGLQMQAASYLRVVYDSIGDMEKSNFYMRFLTNQKKSDGENKALVSKMEDIYKDYLNQKQEKKAEEAREKSIRKTVKVIIPITIIIALTVFVVVKLRSKKLLKKQQEKADRILGETEQAHEKELRLWQAEADKTLEETKKKYEEELRQLKAETEERLAEVERKHQQWMAETKERHDEELKAQKDRSEKEIENTKRRHERELELERLAYEKEQDTLRQNLKDREAQIIELEKTMSLQRKLQTQVEQAAQHTKDALEKRTMGIYLSRDDNRLQRIFSDFESVYPHAVEKLEARHSELTEQERNVVVLSFLRFRAKEMAELLGLTEGTVQKYRSNIRKKVGNDPISKVI